MPRFNTFERSNCWAAVVAAHVTHWAKGTSREKPPC